VKDYRTSFKIAVNGFGLCVRWGLEAQKYQTAMKIDRCTALEYNTEPPLAQNPCYLLPLPLTLIEEQEKRKI